jgi:UDP-3-O-[3-hydroxymyristoyl] N-acetylglucosamine deacetylase
MQCENFCEEILNIEQRTLSRALNYTGLGLHAGEACQMTIHPAKENTGILFRRSGCDRFAKASWDWVIDSQLSTVLGADPRSLLGGRFQQKIGVAMMRYGIVSTGKKLSGQIFSTVEHVLAALSGANVDNAEIELSSPEVPILDGSSLPFTEQLMAPDTVIPIQNSRVKIIRVLKHIEVRSNGGRSVSLAPLSSEHTSAADPHDLKITVHVDFGDRIQDGAGGSQRLTMWRRDFHREVAAARTFCFLEDVQAMRAMRLAVGGSLENALVFSGGRLLNPGGLRYADEVVRHKALDAVGDLRLGGRLVGQYTGIRPGHALNLRLLKKLFTGIDRG